MQELRELAKEVKKVLKLEYDGDSIKLLEGFIERQKTQFTQEEKEGLINSCAAFLGQCIIENYGGNWKRDPDDHSYIAFDEKNCVYPFSKVRKQFENGLDDSIHSFYTVIPWIFKLEPKVKKKWWQF
jgi:hypothetical protein